MLSRIIPPTYNIQHANMSPYKDIVKILTDLLLFVFKTTDTLMTIDTIILSNKPPNQHVKRLKQKFKAGSHMKTS